MYGKYVRYAGIHNKHTLVLMCISRGLDIKEEIRS